MAKKLNKETLLDWYRQIVLIREFEEKCDELYSQKQITGVYMHLYSGHEASGVGALAALEPHDHVITAYRDHGLALILGIDPNKIMAEMMGKKTGTSGGKGGSMHLASREHNFWGGYAIVGGHLPLAAGIALEAQYNETGAVVVCFIGDGATNNGYFHEALNMSAIWNLPVVWIIENNFVGMGTRVEDASGQPELHKRAIAYGMKDMGRVDAQDVLKVYETATKAVEHARAGHGPVLIEHLTYRYKGHGVSDRSYDTRFAEELHEYKTQRDPITLLRNHLTEKYKNIEDELHAIHQEVKDIVERAVEFAESSPEPTFEDLVKHVYVE
ncbi:MAG: pyruvate dehydrogenase (acetyl-transferring) E1 component subunit alpha [Phototrophicales bacterium]|nr:MAG: pyruvate dehydrogenase (acetyl-transferring) E1 component subunit alpha [Phototrophicales bacterium]RMG72737.1 MAG: pyruvate dehydrogenase (acetyl-transferring) E1 component subunit alpha [Chloroflexota bacterium]